MKRKIFCLLFIFSCLSFCGVSFGGDYIVFNGNTSDTISIVDESIVSKNFNVVEKGTVSIRIKSTMKECYIYIRDEDDNSIDDFLIYGSNDYTTLKFNMEKGKYKLCFGERNYSGYTGTITYSCSFKKAEITITENNDTFETASDVMFSTEIKDFLGCGNGAYDSEFYKFEVKSDGYMGLTINTATVGVRFYIYNEYKNIVCEDVVYKTADYKTYSYYLDKGNYIIGFENWNWTSQDSYGEFSFSLNYKKSIITKETNNYTFNDAYELQLGSSFKGVMTENHDFEYFKINVKNNEMITVILNADYDLAYMSLLNSYEEDLKFNSARVNKNHIFTFSVEPGVYYIKLRSSSFWSDRLFKGNYTLSIGKNIGNTKVKLNSKGVYYNGKNQVLLPLVKYNGITLKNNIDYTLAYKNNKYPGRATVIVKGKGLYIGSTSVTFNIYTPLICNPIVKDKSSRTVNLQWSKNNLVTGYVIEKYDPQKKAYVPCKYLSKNITSYTITKLRRNTFYAFRIRGYIMVNKNKIYSPSAKVLKVRTLK